MQRKVNLNLFMVKVKGNSTVIVMLNVKIIAGLRSIIIEYAH